MWTLNNDGVNGVDWTELATRRFLSGSRVPVRVDDMRRKNIAYALAVGVPSAAGQALPCTIVTRQIVARHDFREKREGESGR